MDSDKKLTRKISLDWVRCPIDNSLARRKQIDDTDYYPENLGSDKNSYFIFLKILPPKEPSIYQSIICQCGYKNTSWIPKRLLESPNTIWEEDSLV